MNTIKYFDTISNNENVPNYTIIEILKTMCKDIDMQEISLIQVNKVTDTTYSLNIQLKNGKVITSNTFELAQGPQGPEGPAGPQGPEGPAGPQGIGFNFKTTPYVNNDTEPTVNQVINFTQKPTFVNDVSLGDPVALIYTYNDTSYLCIGTITRWIFLQYQITLNSVNLIATQTTASNQTLNFMTEPYAGTTQPSINQHIMFIQAPSFTNPVNINDSVALIYIYNSISYLCIGTITDMQGTRVNSITLSSVNSVGVDILYGTCNINTTPVVGEPVAATSINFNRTFENNESGIFFATQGASRNYIIFGRIQFITDSMPKMIKCNNVYDITSYKSLTNINIGDIDTVSYADDTATIQTNLILSQNGLETTIPSTIKLPLKAGPNITINADETGKSIVITSSANIASFDSLSDLYTFINQPSIVPLRLIVSLPAISGTLTQIDNNISSNTTTANQEEGYQYFVGREWNIVITEYGPSALAGLSLDISANFSTSFHFAGTALNVYQYSIGYSENLIQSFIFQGILTSLSPTSIKLYYTETT